MNRIATSFDQAFEIGFHRDVFHSLRKDGLLRKGRTNRSRSRAIELDITLVELTYRRRSEETIGDKLWVRDLIVIIRLQADLLADTDAGLVARLKREAPGPNKGWGPEQQHARSVGLLELHACGNFASENVPSEGLPLDGAALFIENIKPKGELFIHAVLNAKIRGIRNEDLRVGFQCGIQGRSTRNEARATVGTGNQQERAGEERTKRALPGIRAFGSSGLDASKSHKSKSPFETVVFENQTSELRLSNGCADTLTLS